MEKQIKKLKRKKLIFKKKKEKKRPFLIDPPRLVKPATENKTIVGAGI